MREKKLVCLAKQIEGGSTLCHRERLVCAANREGTGSSFWNGIYVYINCRFGIDALRPSLGFSDPEQ